MPSRPAMHRPSRPQLREARPHASARGYGAAWRRLRLQILAGRPICEHCGREAAVDVDHLVPLRDGGSNALDNLQALCHSCHSRKTVLADGGLGRPRAERRASTRT